MAIKRAFYYFTLSELSGILNKCYWVSLFGNLRDTVNTLRTDEATKLKIDKLFETYEKVK